MGLVVLPVTVLDKSGRFRSELEEKNFTVYEDGAPKKLQVFDQKDVPVAVGLIIDNSSSMGPGRNEVITAAMDLVNPTIRPTSTIFVIHFYDHIDFALRLGEASTSDIDELRVGTSYCGLEGPLFMMLLWQDWNTCSKANCRNGL